MIYIAIYLIVGLVIALLMVDKKQKTILTIVISVLWPLVGVVLILFLLGIGAKKIWKWIKGKWTAKD